MAGDGACATSGGGCTLRAAIEEANALGIDTNISLPAGTYGISQGELPVTGTIVLRGQDGTTVEGEFSDDSPSRIFHVMGSGDLRISTMIIQNGEVEESENDGPALGGGAIANEGLLRMERVLIRNSYADVLGGLISNSGAMTIVDATMSGGGTFFEGGAGIFNDVGAEAILVRTLISGNDCEHDSRGGGILNYGEMTITDSTLRDNTAVIGSNVLNDTGATLTIEDSEFIGGNEFDGEGGILNRGTLVNDGGNTFSP